MNQTFRDGESVQITALTDPDCGRVGIIDSFEKWSGVYVVRFYDNGPSHDGEFFEYELTMVLPGGIPPLPIRHAKDTSYHMFEWQPCSPTAFGTNTYCSHNWKTDKYFTSKEFTTCTKCGAKKEEL